MTTELFIAQHARPGDKEVIQRCAYTIYDRGPVVPKVVRRGVATIEEAQEIAQEYAKFHRGPIVIVETRTVRKVVRVLS